MKVEFLSFGALFVTIIAFIASSTYAVTPGIKSGDSSIYKMDPVKRIKTDSVVVDFPPGSIKSEIATLKKVSNPDIHYAFDETADVFRAKRKSLFQYVLNIGKHPPQNDLISITLTLPSKISNPLPRNYRYELFAQVIQDGGHEV